MYTEESWRAKQNALPDKLEKVKYNCFVYALGLDADPDFIYFGNNPPRNEIGSKNIHHFIKHGILKQTTSKRRGDLVLYKKDNNFTHAGIVLDKDTIMSKWGTEDFVIRRHKIEDAFGKYGSSIVYCKRTSSEEIKKQWTK